MLKHGMILMLVIVGILLPGCQSPSHDSVPAAMGRYERSSDPDRSGLEGLASCPQSCLCRTDAAQDMPNWLELTSSLGGSDGEVQADTSDVEPSEHAYTPWQKRRGEAYPGDILRSIGRDAKEMPAIMLDDIKATATNPLSLVALTMAGVAGIALSGNRGNDQVEDHYNKHGSQLNTEWDSVGGFVGNPATHFAVSGAAYVLTLAGGDTKHYEASKTMINALALNGLVTLTLKAAVRTESPNGNEFGWPSGHTSSSFTVATVLNEIYGPWVGIPAFAAASFVGYERIDARNHDFSDVISGALIGIAIGHAVVQNHTPRIMGMDLMPYADPSGGVGLVAVKKW